MKKIFGYACYGWGIATSAAVLAIPGAQYAWIFVAGALIGVGAALLGGSDE